MRVLFSAPDEPPEELCGTILGNGIPLQKALRLGLFDYFVSINRPQTSMLPRTVLRRVIETNVANWMEMVEQLPQFELAADPAKLFRCCYRSVWRALLLEWKARLLLAWGRTPEETEFPSGFDPWIDLPEGDSKKA
jgi:hypothetical protein